MSWSKPRFDSYKKLSDLGERQIIQDILSARYEAHFDSYFGNDCAIVSPIGSIEGDTLIATTDPCPPPMADYLGFDDLYYWGWLLATINLSDLAAAGAHPISLLTSLVLPNELKINAFESLLNGIDDCCGLFDTNVVGGNIKESDQINLSATAIGSCFEKELMSRTGAHEGDLVVAIGDLGLFWAGVVSIQQGISWDPETELELFRKGLRPCGGPSLRVNLC